MIELLGNKPTLLFGHSRGGATANLVGTQNPLVNAIVTVNASLGAPSPPDSETLHTGIYKDSRDLPPGTKKTKKRKYFEMSLGYFEDGANYDDARLLKKCTKPKLMFYSVNDEFNKPKYVKEVFESIPDPKILHELPGTHDYRYFPQAIKEVNKELGKFLDKYNI